MPEEIVVAPEYVFAELAGASDNTPSPILVRPAPDTTPVIVAVNELSTLTLESVARFTVPDIVDNCVIYNAPFVAEVPFSTRGSLMLTERSTSTCNVAPSLTDVPDASSPNAESLVIFNVPLETFVIPVKSLSSADGDNVNVDVFDFDTAPAPVILLVSVWSDADAYDNSPDDPIVIKPA